MGNQSATEKTSLLSRVGKSETLLAILVPAFAYLVTYLYKRSYFSHFSIDPMFVSVSISDLLASATFLVAASLLSIGLWTIFDLPATIFSWVIVFLLGHRPPFLLFTIFAANFLKSGQTWLTGTLLLGTLLAFADELRRVHSYLSKGGRYVDYLGHWLQFENERQERTLGSKAMNSIGLNTFVLLFFLPIVGGLSAVLGTTLARDQESFPVWETNGSTYILVGTSYDGVVFSSIENNSPEPSYLSDPPKVIWLSNEELSGLALRTAMFVEGVQSKTPTE